jgi:hypothetical protein
VNNSLFLGKSKTDTVTSFIAKTSFFSRKKLELVISENCLRDFNINCDLRSCIVVDSCRTAHWVCEHFKTVKHVSVQLNIFLKIWTLNSVCTNKRASKRAFHRFGQAKFSDGGSVLGSSQFSVLPQLPPKTMLSLKEVKIN